MNNAKFSLLVILGIGFIGIGLSAFTVDETELAIKLRLGEVVRADYEPGLHWKIPVVHTVRKFPKRILTISDRPERVFTAENEALEVDFFVKWRVITHRQAEHRSSRMIDFQKSSRTQWLRSLASAQ